MNLSTHYFCKICTIHKKDAQKTCVADSNLLRTTDSFSYLSCQQNYANSDTINFFGIKYKTALLNLAHFKLSENLNIDVMHDFLEDVCYRDLKLFINFCNKSGFITLNDLNEVQAFDYGLCNRKKSFKYYTFK